MSLLREVFAEDGAKEPGLSSSQVLMFLHAAAGIAWVSIVVWHGKVLPDAVTLAGITAFVVAPYAISQFRSGVTAASNGTKPANGSQP